MGGGTPSSRGSQRGRYDANARVRELVGEGVGGGNRSSWRTMDDDEEDDEGEEEGDEEVGDDGVEASGHSIDDRVSGEGGEGQGSGGVDDETEHEENENRVEREDVIEVGINDILREGPPPKRERNRGCCGSCIVC